jgi:hypothetical protein
MRRLAWMCCAVLLIGCTKSQDNTKTAADSAAAAPAPAPAAPAALSLTDVAGTWNVKSMPENKDSVVVTYVLTAKPDTSGWTIQFANRKDLVPVHVVGVQGDSVVVHAGPYKSALRAGITVEIDGVSRLENGKLVGRTVAHYKTTGPDTVRVFRTEGTRGQ